jgi:hypothetical protein
LHNNSVKIATGSTVTRGKRLGVAKGLFDVPDNIDQHNSEVAELFMGWHQ